MVCNNPKKALEQNPKGTGLQKQLSFLNCFVCTNFKGAKVNGSASHNGAIYCSELGQLTDAKEQQ